MTTLALVAAAMTFADAARTTTIDPPSPPPYSLVVLITVDQMRADYLDRWKAQWTGGFRQLLDQGTFFVNGQQDHAATETAPGHATLLSGRSPASTNIVTNELGVPDSLSPVIGVAGEPGASPRRFRGSTLFDWMLAADPDTRVLSVSRKDRGAILPIGQARVPVFWYAQGLFTTSTWYSPVLPDWVVAFNARNGPARLAGTTWNLLLAPSAYPESDDRPFENGGSDVVFPHVLPGPNVITGAIREYPWMDSLTADFALEGVRRLQLGVRGRPDLLAVSFSTTDVVGHKYGPGSREIHDQMLRLDRWLGWFLDSLAGLVPRDRTIVVLTADHGVTAFPEWSKGEHRTGGRVSLDSLAWATGQRLRGRYLVDFDLGTQSGLLFADVAALRARGVNVDSLATALARVAKSYPGVRKVYTPRTLAQAPASDVDAARWRRSLPPDLGWLVCGALEPGYMWAAQGAWTTHGTTNPDDVNVPILFRVPGAPAGRSDAVARTIDIGPTLAVVLGVRPTEKVDGHPLNPVVHGRRTP